MIDPEFLELDAVLFLHDQALREYGGAQGVRDQSLLESALGRTRNKLLYETDVDLFDLAASVAFGLACNHAFNDGNKRTAWGCCVLFLRINGQRIKTPAIEIIDAVVDLAQGKCAEATFADWLRSHSNG